MRFEDRQKLRKAALGVRLRDAGASSPSTRWPTADRWTIQTSNSHRRIGARGDGDVLCGTTQRSDGHPDLLAAPGVLEHIVAAQPAVVLELLNDLDQLEAVARSRAVKMADAATQLAAVAAAVEKLGSLVEQLAGSAGPLTTLRAGVLQLAALLEAG